MGKLPLASIPSLTGIRGLAALWVMTYHLQLVAPYFGLPIFNDVPLLRDGWVGVEVFFMLSGFILMYTHEGDFRTIEAKRLFDFAWLRFFRIYPLATVVLLLILVVVILDPEFAVWYRRFDWPTSLTIVPFIKTLFLATRWIPPFRGDWNQPVWSLSVEIVGYCAFPWLAWAVTRLPRPALPLVIAAASIITPIVLAALLPVPPYDIRAWAFVRMGASFTGGVALCRAWRLLPELDDNMIRTGAVASFATIIAIGLLQARAQWMAVPCASLIFFLAYQNGVVDRALSSRVALFFGHISFPLYLVHVMALLWLRHFVTSHDIGWPVGAVILVAGIVALLVVSYGLHRLVERPTHGWARRWLRCRRSGEEILKIEQAAEAAERG